jgi:hypothetical protein
MPETPRPQMPETPRSSCARKFFPSRTSVVVLAVLRSHRQSPLNRPVIGLFGRSFGRRAPCNRFWEAVQPRAAFKIVTCH